MTEQITLQDRLDASQETLTRVVAERNDLRKRKDDLIEVLRPLVNRASYIVNRHDRGHEIYDVDWSDLREAIIEAENILRGDR